MKKPNTRFQLVGLLVLLAILVSRLDQMDPPVGDWFRPAPEAPFEQRECWFPVEKPAHVTCGYLATREKDAEGAPLLIPVAVFKTHAWFPEPDPVLLLGGGGPGNPVGLTNGAAEDFPFAFGALSLEQGRDLIVVDPRGVGAAQPNLTCSGMRSFLELALGWRASDPRTRDAYTLTLHQCRSRWQRQGYDLAAFNTTASAHDLRALRRALGYEQWNLLGISYASELAFALLEQDAPAVRSAVLDSPSLPGTAAVDIQVGNLDRALQRVWSACAASEDCAETFPNLPERFAQLLERLNREPVMLTVTHPHTLKPVQMLLDDSALIDLVFQMLYDMEDIEHLPLLIYATAQGSYDLITTRARKHLADLLEPSSEGLAQSVLCAEGFPGEDWQSLPQRLSRFPLFLQYGLVLSDFTRMGCKAWEVPPTQRTIAVPQGTDIPMLVLSGEFDPVTPPEWGLQIKRRVKHGVWWEFPQASHNVLADHDCVVEAAGAFLDHPLDPPDPSECLDAQDPVAFDFTPD